MHTFSLAHLSDAVLLRDLSALVARERLTTAELLAHIAEVDSRRLYAPLGYPSMHAYCVEELRLSEDAAAKRIQAARAARRFPALFSALADGRLHLAGVCLLAPHLTEENADELVQAATHRRKSEIEAWLAQRFDVPEIPPLVRAIPAHAPGHVRNTISVEAGELALGRVGAPGVAPHPEERYLVQATISRSTHEKLRYAQALLSHAVPTGDVAHVLDRALDVLIAQLERRKFGAAARERVRPPRLARREDPCWENAATRARCIPAHVRRAVWEQDQGRCTFVSASGKRCGARSFLQFDHIEPVARGGRASVEGLRLRCRAHNQLEAERVFGAGFMSRKREEARAVAKGRAEPLARFASEARTRAEEDLTKDVIAGLRSLGCRADQARRAAEQPETLRCATLEERMRAALEHLGRRRLGANRMPVPAG
jgi:5-methylcytosine-specific restriction endonuclease McrA